MNMNWILTGLGTLAAAAITAVGSQSSAAAAPPNAVGAIEEVYAQANAALMKGDSETWTRLMPLGEDFVLFSPFGGNPSRFADYTPERIERMGKFFRNGSFRQEVVQTFATNDMIVLATIEHCNVEVGGLPAQDWALRVTSVFTKRDGRWVLAHRHADPLVASISTADSARLARGDGSTAAR
jgi:ketosteroid isomerase-like protein